MSRHLKNLNLLTTIAEGIEPVGNAKIAAGIFLKNTLVALGTNQNKTDTFQNRFKPRDKAIYLHAENSAIKQALNKIGREELSKTVLYVARVKKDHKRSYVHGLACPCIGCQAAIAEFNIKKVFYTTGDERVFECLEA